MITERMMKMTCPICEGKVRVVYSLSDVDSVIRKRQCCECGHMFYTSEIEDPAAHGIYKALVNDRDKRKRKGGVE